MSLALALPCSVSNVESRAVARMLPYATDSRCPSASAGELCRKAHAREPWLPVLPQFGSSTETGLNPCLRLDVGGGAVMNSCLPGAHVLAGWHSLAAEALKPLFQHPELRLVRGMCFGHWNGDQVRRTCSSTYYGHIYHQVRRTCSFTYYGYTYYHQGAVRWARSFGTPRRGTLLVQFCQEVLQWYPAFAGRFMKDWGGSYVPCKQRELEKLREAGKDESSYYKSVMWRSCRPAALAAHDAATGAGGPAAELTPPHGMRNLYGAQHGRMLLVPSQPQP